MLALGEFSNSFLRVEVSSASESSESKHSSLWAVHEYLMPVHGILKLLGCADRGDHPNRG